MKNDAFPILAKTVLAMGVSMLIVAGLARVLMHSADASLLPRLLAMLQRFTPAVAGAYLATAAAQALLRAWRYRLLIAAARPPAVPAMGHLTLVTLVRNMLVDLLPARLGELSYIAMLNRGYRVSGAVCVSSLAVSFIFDLIALLVFLAGLAAGQVLLQDLQPPVLAAAGVLAILSAGSLAVLFRGVGWLRRRWTRRRASGGPVQRALLDFARSLEDALRQTGRRGVLGTVLLLSLAIRSVKYGALYMLFVTACGALTSPVGGLSVPAVLAALVGAEAAAGLPLPTFMGFGTYEAGGVAALTLLGGDRSAALLIFLAIHVVTQSADYLLGGLAGVVFVFTAGSRRRGQAGDGAPRPKRWPWAVAAAIAVVVGMAAVAHQYRLSRKMGPWVAPPAGRPAAATPAATRKVALPAGTRASVVWSSNRFGNHEIMLMTLPDGRRQRLTHHPHVDYFARFSPEGRRIVFARSRQVWVSQRNPHLWDVYLLELATGREQRIAEFANTPCWSQDGQRIYFLRHGSQLVAYDLHRGTERVVAAAGDGRLPAGVVLETPSACDRRRSTALTLRGSVRGTALLPEQGSLRRVAKGCQLTWADSGDFLYFIDKGGRQRNAVYRMDADSLEPSLWLDAPGDYSHEYFPKLSRDGRFLVFGASRKGHEHDSADYEIFLWRCKAAGDEIQRLTHHTGNDCWPDIVVTTN